MQYWYAGQSEEAVRSVEIALECFRPEFPTFQSSVRHHPIMPAELSHPIGLSFGGSNSNILIATQKGLILLAGQISLRQTDVNMQLACSAPHLLCFSALSSSFR